MIKGKHFLLCLYSMERAGESAKYAYILHPSIIPGERDGSEERMH